MQRPSETHAPRRLAPQRKSKPTTTSSVANSTPIPIDISLDPIEAHDDNTLDENVNLITNTLADWTLNQNINEINGNDDESEEESYHGEIESQSEEQSESTVSPDELPTPEGYAPVSLGDISTYPPPCSPLVLVNLQSLCGCKPDLSERGVLISQITEALYGDSAEETKQDDNAANENGEGLEFDSRVVELFESGVGSHIDSSVDLVKRIQLLDANDAQDCKSSEEDEIRSLAVIPYPEFLSDSTTLQSTNRLWKLLHTPHPVPLIERLFKHLRNTSRSLFWKVEMHNQLRLLVIDEHKAMVRRLANEEYEEWKVVRKERLEKLYEVRETFLLRVNVARDRYDQFVEERERRVTIEMRRRRGDLWVESKKVVERESLKEKIDVFEEDQSYDDDGWGGVIKEDDIIGENDVNHHIVTNEHSLGDDDNDDESNEEWSPVGMSVVVRDSSNPAVCERNEEDKREQCPTFKRNDTINKLQPITVDDNAERKTKRLEKIANQSTSHSAIVEEEALVRQKLKTTDELMAEAMLKNLQQRLDDVDNLLESIQEEEWADEEEDGQIPVINDDLDNAAPDPSEMSLLDQILAMILGALPMTFSGASSEEEHYQFVKDEHKSIADSWKEIFGRLPLSNTHAEAKNDSKIDLEKVVNVGAVSEEKFISMNNGAKDWDEVDWDTLLP